MKVSNPCLFIYMVRTPDVAHQLLNPAFSDLCLSSLYPCACLQCVASHYVVLSSFLSADAYCIITLATLCYSYTVLYYLITLFNAVNYPYSLLCLNFIVAILCLPVITVRTLCTSDCAPRERCRGAKRTECLNYGYCSNEKEQWF